MQVRSSCQRTELVTARGAGDGQRSWCQQPSSILVMTQNPFQELINSTENDPVKRYHLENCTGLTRERSIFNAPIMRIEPRETRIKLAGYYPQISRNLTLMKHSQSLRVRRSTPDSKMNDTFWYFGLVRRKR
jgi:hypothetical protein